MTRAGTYTPGTGATTCVTCPPGTWIGAPLARGTAGAPDCTVGTRGTATPVCRTTVTDPDTGSVYSVTNDEPVPGAVLYPMRPNTCLNCPSNYFNPFPRGSAASHYNVACRCELVHACTCTHAHCHQQPALPHLAH